MISNMKNIRIETIADMVKESMVVADIGTDHAFLPVLLVKNHICKKCYACDIRKGPLESASANIQAAGLSDQIPVILSDGLEHVPSDVNAIVIAGMGFQTAVHILENDLKRLYQFKQIIVEVNRDTISMRKWINNHHFTIDDERYVREKNHDYICISFNPSYHKEYSEAEIVLGPVLLQKYDPEYMDYLKARKAKLEKIQEVSNGHMPHASDVNNEYEILTAAIKKDED